MAVTRHQLLAAMHELLKPSVYLEVGVQYGSSLILAEAAEVAYGIDPNPLLQFAPQNQLPNQRLYTMTSDQFFKEHSLELPLIDLAFIDGSHLYEDALRDFVNIQRHMRPGGYIVFDDVLPYNDAIAHRVEPPGGDWTGDVWKVLYLLETWVGTEYVTPVDTWPTGTMVVGPIEPKLNGVWEWYESVVSRLSGDHPVPSEIINRSVAVPADYIMELIRERLE